MKRLLLTGMLIVGLSVGMSACQKQRESLTQPEGTVEASEMLQAYYCLPLSIEGGDGVRQYNMRNHTSYNYIGKAMLKNDGLIVKNISSYPYSYKCSVAYGSTFQQGVIAAGQTISCVGKNYIIFRACPLSGVKYPGTF